MSYLPRVHVVLLFCRVVSLGLTSLGLYNRSVMTSIACDGFICLHGSQSRVEVAPCCRNIMLIAGVKTLRSVEFDKGKIITSRGI